MLKAGLNYDWIDSTGRNFISLAVYQGLRHVLGAMENDVNAASSMECTATKSRASRRVSLKWQVADFHRTRRSKIVRGPLLERRLGQRSTSFRHIIVDCRSQERWTC